MGEGPPAPARRLRILFVINNLYTTGNGLAASARRTIALLRDADAPVMLETPPENHAEEIAWLREQLG